MDCSGCCTFCNIFIGGAGSLSEMQISARGLLGVIKDYGTGIFSIAVSRAAGKKTHSVLIVADLTNADLITPVSGTRLQIAGVYVGTQVNVGELTLRFATSGITVFYFDSSKYQHSSVLDCADVGQADEPLQITTTMGVGNKLLVKVNYRQIK